MILLFDIEGVLMSNIIYLTGQEDCLYLNLYAPVKPDQGSDPLPVMVWIHGGGFTMGSGSAQDYGPRKFMDTSSVILVSEVMLVLSNMSLVSGHYQLPPEWPRLAESGQGGGPG